MSPRLRTFALLSLSALLVSVASCGGGSSGGSQAVPDGPTALVRLLDADVPVVVHVDADGLRRSPYYALVHDAILGVLNEREQSQFRAVVELLDRTDHIVLGANPTADTGLLMFRGNYQPSDLETLNPPDGQFTHRQYSLRGNERARGVVTSHTLLIGTAGSVHNALDRLDGLMPATGPTLSGFPEAAGRAHLGERDVSAVVLLTDDIRANMGHGDVEDALREAGLSAGGSLDARNGIRLSGFFTASSEGAVQLLARHLREGLAEAQGDMTLAMLGLGVLFQQIQIEERGTDLMVEFHLDDTQVRDLIERFGPLLEAMTSAL